VLDQCGGVSSSDGSASAAWSLWPVSLASYNRSRDRTFCAFCVHLRLNCRAIPERGSNEPNCDRLANRSTTD
jgi:hypothetical protein